jgi:hypothetical protein
MAAPALRTRAAFGAVRAPARTVGAAAIQTATSRENPWRDPLLEALEL